MSRLGLLGLVAVLATACAEPDPQLVLDESLTASSIETDDIFLEVREDAMTVRCAGSVNFKSEPGVTTPLYDRMNGLADRLCDGKSESDALNINVNASSGTAILESIEINFSCADSDIRSSNMTSSSELVSIVEDACTQMFQDFRDSQE